MRAAFSLVWAITPLAYMGLRGIVTLTLTKTDGSHTGSLSSVLSGKEIKGCFIFMSIGQTGEHGRRLTWFFNSILVKRFTYCNYYCIICERKRAEKSSLSRQYSCSPSVLSWNEWLETNNWDDVWSERWRSPVCASARPLRPDTGHWPAHPGCPNSKLRRPATGGPSRGNMQTKCRQNWRKQPGKGMRQYGFIVRDPTPFLQFSAKRLLFHSISNHHSNIFQTFPPEAEECH